MIFKLNPKRWGLFETHFNIKKHNRTETTILTPGCLLSAEQQAGVADGHLTTPGFDRHFSRSDTLPRAIIAPQVKEDMESG